MSLVPEKFVAQRATRMLSRYLKVRNRTQLLSRTLTNGSTRLGHQERTGATTTTTTTAAHRSRRDINLALLGGSMLVLSFAIFGSNNVVRLDSISGIRQYTTSTRDAVATDQNSSKKSSPGEPILLLSDEEVTQRLHANQASYLVDRGKGIIRYDVSQLPSNHPIEDTHVEQVITVPSKNAEVDNLYFFGVFDGHSGGYTSAKLRDDLIGYVARELVPIYDDNTQPEDFSKIIDQSIEKGFLQLDKDIVYGGLKQLLQEPTKERLLGALPAISGSCALLSMFDSATSSLKVAVTGDSRALLGGIDEKGEWVVQSLSTDQTGDNEDEVTRIRQEHPNEPNVIRNGRILGSLQPSRAFGDYRYKVKDIDGKDLTSLPEHLRVYFRSKPRNFLSPPYVTAKPVITTAQVVPGRTKFMVVASDGLFELLSNEEIAAHIVKWMEHNKMVKTPLNSRKLPTVKDISTNSADQRPPFRYRSSKTQEDMKSNYFLQDANASTHLIRNALGVGGSKEYVSTLLSIPSPLSRKYRDDLTVTVVFFDEQANTPSGAINCNPEATTAPKSKL